MQLLDDRNFAAANAAIFLVAYTLIDLGYFLGLKKSILTPMKTVPYLGFRADSAREVFHLIPEKQRKFIDLVHEILQGQYLSVKTLQRLVGKCVSFSLAVPAARLFTREMNIAISRGITTQKPIFLTPPLRDEIAHWLFLESWDSPLPWRDERHIQVKLATDASQSGWGGILISPEHQQTSDYWSEPELACDIATKEAMAINRVLHAFKSYLINARVDVLVDNQAVIHAWNNQGSRSSPLNNALKTLFNTSIELNVLLCLSYVPTKDNPADKPSRRLSISDSKLTPALWQKVQQECGGDTGHSCDLMALDSNVMTDLSGSPLPHFSPLPSPRALAVNLFAQHLPSYSSIMNRPYVFPPLILVGPLLKFLRNQQQSCTIVILDQYPRKYWWPLLQSYSVKHFLLAPKGSDQALLTPTKQGWTPMTSLFADLWIFMVEFS